MMRIYLLRNRAICQEKTGRGNFDGICAFGLVNHILNCKRPIFHRRVSTGSLYISSKRNRLSETYRTKINSTILKLRSSKDMKITSKNRIGRPRIKFLCNSLEVFFPMTLIIPNFLLWKKTVSLRSEFKSSSHAGYLKMLFLSPDVWSTFNNWWGNLQLPADLR